jgi:uncharacterized RDD family membrane protein YckC
MMLDDRFYTIETPEQIDVAYDIAGIGSRFLAAMVDHFLIGMVLFFSCLGLALIVDLIAPDMNMFLVLALFGISLFLMLCAYYIFFETVWNGQTPGKRLAGVRMLRTDGRPIGFLSSTTRNVIRLVDFLPAFYGVGFLAMFIDKRSRRLGDMAAGCIAVRERTQITLASLMDSVAHDQVVVPAATHMTIPNLHVLRRSDYDLVQEFLQRRASLSAETRQRLAQQLANALQQRLGYPVQGDAETFLQRVAAEYQARLNAKG